MRINTEKQHRDVHRALVDQTVALRLIAERVAEKLGISLDGPDVTYRAYFSSRDTSTGREYDAVVEITDDHASKPTAG